MQRLNGSEVLLSDRERVLSENFEDLLDAGFSIPQAVQVLTAIENLAPLDPAFVEYLAH